jgi:hypothetical protein
MKRWRRRGNILQRWESAVRWCSELWVGLWVEVFGATPGNLLKQMVGLGGLEPPTSPLSGARSSHLSYRPQHRRGNVHNYLIVRWFSVFRNCAESALRYKTATSPVHSLCTISESEFRQSRRVQSARRQDVLVQPGSAVFWRTSDQQTELQCGSSKINF